MPFQLTREFHLSALRQDVTAYSATDAPVFRPVLQPNLNTMKSLQAVVASSTDDAYPLPGYYVIPEATKPMMCPCTDVQFV